MKKLNTAGNIIESKTFFSIFSGTIYELPIDFVNSVDEGQFPLVTKPKNTCRCYGRGYESFDAKQNTYNMCSCMRKCIDPLFVPKEIRVPIEKFA